MEQTKQAIYLLKVTVDGKREKQFTNLRNEQ